MLVRWRKPLPPMPALPPALWGTAGALPLVLVRNGFRAGLWSNHPAAGSWSLALLPVLVSAGLPQLLNALYNWLAVLAGPHWLRLALRAAMAVVQVGAALLLVLASVVGLIAVAELSQNGKYRAAHREPMN